MDDFKDVQVAYFVTVCDNAAESCPMLPGKAKVIRHSFDDPPRLAQGAATEEEAVGHYRRVRDEIKTFIENLPGAFN
ncbi:low molecular weight phosphatase family protein [Lacipirellula limnantheis]|uniref:Protein ArsC n=1 Tax=Lacipirellula limnantheis TaxID=2528024 RepID=A0A517TXX3_9BACT|nr:hypothetical protein [Lacipirellula limnantheis]QDT73234.1 Protein ArsC [Lacipirellula limnantheis]